MTRRRADRGAVAVELALLLPVLVLVVGGLIDLGNALRVQVQLEEAVQDGAVNAIYNPGSPAQTRQRVAEAGADLSLNASAVTVTCSGTAPVIVMVRAVHEHHWMTGLLPGGSVTMTAEIRGDVMSTVACVGG